MFKKTYKEVKPHSSEESEDKVDEGERDKHDNHEHIYYFLMKRAPAIIRGWNGGWGVTLYFSQLLSFLLQAASVGVGDFPYVRGTETQEYLKWPVELIN